MELLGLLGPGRSTTYAPAGEASNDDGTGHERCRDDQRQEEDGPKATQTERDNQTKNRNETDHKSGNCDHNELTG